MSWSGTLVHQDLGSGVWLLVTRDGKRLQLDGDIPEDLEGSEVVVEGRSESLFGFGMAGGGKGIRVSSVKRA